MDGLAFCDIPWLLQAAAAGRPDYQQVAGLWPEAARQYARLYALGVDAYGLVPYLEGLRDNPYGRYAGETGRLHLDFANRVRRDLLWARFTRGQPRLLEVAPAAVRGAGTSLLPGG
jgi:uncharacterized protein